MSENFHPYSTFGDHTIPHLPVAPIKIEDSVPDYMLEIRQQPQHARVALGKDKDRKPIDPPPILQLRVSHKKDPMQHFLQSPYYFMSCSLLKGDETSSKDPLPSYLIGTVVSSLHRLKDTDNQDGGFFVFGDLSCKVEGKFRLLFTLYQMQKTECFHITSTVSDVFQVYPTKSFPGLAESTFLTRSFSDQGVRLRLRKDSRSITTRKRNAKAAEFARKTQSQQHHDRRVLAGRTDSTHDSSSYGTMAGISAAQVGFDTHAGTVYGNYSTDIGLPKRRRMIGDEVTASHPYGTVGGSNGSGPDMSAYGASRGSYNPSPHMTLPVSSASYGMSVMQTTAATMGYGTATGPHQLGRMQSQLAGAHQSGPGSAASMSFQSAPSRQSSHAFQYGTMQPASSSMAYQPASATATSMHALTGSPSGDYRSHPGTLYTSSVSTDASPRSHSTPNPHNSTPSGTSTSPPDATTANYTAAAGGSMTPFSQGLSPYSYSHALGDPQAHIPSSTMATARSHGLRGLDLQHVNGGGLGLDMNYSEVDRHTHGQV
ncbi:developmental regulator [Grosmannia clavigera kw1407]|uniref:Developmental regulator n=1 Tax=Grosmannia clavigera (strain kw1407 / UAMH 11150) TaxID=655863 RepID=F0XL85_GROCL|nr:developmental regulator [Grosmannia clavigera kw1407]EFX01338.1 developmental regulator [Grosmannia clavigera kw1407]